MLSIAAVPRTLNAFAYEELSVGAVAVGFTAATIKETGVATWADRRPAQAALVTCETNTIRFRLDGTAPTASVGHALIAGDSLWLDGMHAIANFKAIQASAGATLRVTFFR